MKKKYLLLILLSFFFLIPIAHAETVNVSEVKYFWRGKVANSSNLEQGYLVFNQKTWHEWGSGTAEYDFINSAILLSYVSNGSSMYQAKVRFYYSLPPYEGFYFNTNQVSCHAYASDISNSTCTVVNTGITSDLASPIVTSKTFYVDVTYSFNTKGSSYSELWLTFNDVQWVPAYTYFSYEILSLNSQVSDEQIIIDQNKALLDRSEQQIEQQKDTNKKLDDLNKNTKDTQDFLTDDTAPDSDISALGNVQGLLPAGPVDSLLNIPFQFLSVVTSSISGTCVPMSGKFVFDSTLTLPCFDSILWNSEELDSNLMNYLSLIPAAFILIKYFKYLYKKVERATSLESNADDEWGVL